MSITTNEDLQTQPLREMQEAYLHERAQVKPPANWREDLSVPLKAADQAVQAARNAGEQLARVRKAVNTGGISRDQADVQRKRVIEDANLQVEQFTNLARKTMQALPSRVVARAWPDTVPTGIDWDTVALEWQSVKPVERGAVLRRDGHRRPRTRRHEDGQGPDVAAWSGAADHQHRQGRS